MFEGIVNKRVLVTGGGTGIGASIAQLFARFGAVVGIHYSHSQIEAEQVLRVIESASGRAKLLKGDLLDPSVRRNLVSSFVENFGGIDVLINNAGGLKEYKHFIKLDEDDWDYGFELQVKAPFFLSRDAYVHMTRQRWGRIISVSSVAVKYAGASSLPYSASKAALEAMMLGLARDGAKANVLVNVIRPGLIDTGMRTKLANYDEEAFKRRANLIPMGRPGEPIDVSRMALFLASECGDFITGECFAVAGGD